MLLTGCKTFSPGLSFPKCKVQMTPPPPLHSDDEDETVHVRASELPGQGLARSAFSVGSPGRPSVDCPAPSYCRNHPRPPHPDPKDMHTCLPSVSVLRDKVPASGSSVSSHPEGRSPKRATQKGECFSWFAVVDFSLTSLP